MVSIPYPLGIAHSPPRVILNTPLTQCPGRFLPLKRSGLFLGEIAKASLPLIARSSFLSIFQVSNRTNRFTARNNDRYSARQKELHDYIKSLYDSGMSYRRITKLLNKKGIKTHTGKEWGETGNSVYSVLKKYRQREERLELLNREYELE